jgi:hypothetical protein
MGATGKVWRARGVVRGRAEGEALVCAKPFSFLGDVDMDTGEIIARDHPLRGQSIAGKIMVYPETKGSSGGCVVLMSLARVGRAPAAIVLTKPADFNIVEGAILLGLPLLAEPEGDLLSEVRTGDRLVVDAAANEIRRLPPPRR